MPTKTIPIAKEDCKGTNKRLLLEIVGILSKGEASKMEKEIKGARSLSNKRNLVKKIQKSNKRTNKNL